MSWFLDTPKRAINRAYQAALKIKAIEDRYFNSQLDNKAESTQQENTISFEHSDRTAIFLQAEIKKYLKIIKIRLKEFEFSSNFLSFVSSTLGGLELDRSFTLEDRSQSNFIEQLQSIEAILNRYDRPKVERELTKPGAIAPIETVSDKTSLLPRSFFRTYNQIKEDISPPSPAKDLEVLQKYRQSRQKTVVSCRFLLTLIIVPFLTYQISKTLIVKPIVAANLNTDRLHFIEQDLEEEAFAELQSFEYKLYFKSLAGVAPEITPTERKIKLKEKVSEIIEKYRRRSIDGVANIFADLFSFFSFVLILIFCQREIIVFKSFLDNLIYGLSDSAKAFTIILFTDMLVGFHSPHGWEIVLESVARHFGLPESREFNFLFIATFPVILDTILKYWIFRYLNRISPSSVATYRDMNQ